MDKDRELLTDTCLLRMTNSEKAFLKNHSKTLTLKSRDKASADETGKIKAKSISESMIMRQLLRAYIKKVNDLG